MDSDEVQRTRYLLQARVRTAKSCPPFAFLTACRHLLAWMQAHPLISGILAPLQPRVDAYYREARALVKVVDAGDDEDHDAPLPSDPSDLAAIALAVLRLVSEAKEIDDTEGTVALHFLGADSHPNRTDGRIDPIRDVAIEAIYGYVDERIDARNMTLALLRKYKARSQLFRRNRLLQTAIDGLEGSKGERALVIDLHEYMHDQGVDFHVEPASSSGYPDIVSERSRGTRAVIEAKWIAPESTPSAARASAIQAFTQVSRYCQDLDEPTGYLAIFNGSNLALEIAGCTDDGFPCVRRNSRSVYYVVIDIHAHAEPASKQAPARIVQVTEADLVFPESDSVVEPESA